MKFNKLSAVVLLTLVFVFGVSFTGEARVHSGFSFNVGSCCSSAPVVVQRPCYYPQPVYVVPPSYERVVVYPQPVVYQPVYEPVYVYPAPRPSLFSGFSFGFGFGR